MLRLIRLSFRFLLLLSVSAACWAQVVDPAAQKICAEVKNVEIPAQDRPTAEESKALAHCDSKDLYYGFGAPADVNKARKCAYLEMDKGDSQLPFGGRNMLTMIYANGKGVPRNLDLAIKFACLRTGAPVDIDGTIHQLGRFKQVHWAAANFSVCDHSSSHYLYGECVALQEMFDSKDRQQQIESITSQWTPAEKKAFEPLLAAGKKFFKLHASRERDLSGTFEVQELAFTENQFIGMLRQLEGGSLPSFSAEDLRKTEAAMQGYYRDTQNGKKQSWGTVTRDGIKAGQEAWLAYRDAWVKFGMKKYPSVSADSWKTWVTQQRVEMLEYFSH